VSRRRTGRSLVGLFEMSLPLWMDSEPDGKRVKGRSLDIQPEGAGDLFQATVQRSLHWSG